MYFAKAEGNVKQKKIEYRTDIGIGDKNTAMNGDVIYSYNTSYKNYPCLSPRDKYFTSTDLGGITGLGFSGDIMYYTKGEGFYFNGVYRGPVTNNRKRFVNFGDSVIIYPDKKYYNAAKRIFDVMERSVTGIEINVYEGSLGNTDAGVNTIKGTNFDLTTVFKPGDGVLIEGFPNSYYDGGHTVKEVNTVSKEIRFGVNEFGSSGNYTFKANLKYGIPDADRLCACEGRVWAVKGTQIFASARGNLINWNAFDIGDDSAYRTDSMDCEKFTYCTDVAGYPILFTESKIYKMYGDCPNNFTLKCVCKNCGVPSIFADSVADTGKGVMYLSGDMQLHCYDGTSEKEIEGLPRRCYTSAYACCDGDEYRICLKDINGESYQYVYSIKFGRIYEVNADNFEYFACYGGTMYAAALDDKLKVVKSEGYSYENYEEDSRSVKSEIIYSDFYPDGETCTLQSISLIAETNDDSVLAFYVMYDSDGEWHRVKTLTGVINKKIHIPLRARTCECWRLRIVGNGDYKIKKLYASYI